MCKPGYAGRTSNIEKASYPLLNDDPRLFFDFHHKSLFSWGIQISYFTREKVLFSQSHYDYGMRKVQATIKLASMLHRDFPEADEEQLLLEALVTQLSLV